MPIIETYRGVEEISETTYWHLVPATGSRELIFKNNARVGRGLIHSVSYSAELDPNLLNACTPYSFATIGNEKEIFFEQIRVERFSHLPSRLKAMYLFPSREMAERAQQEWFSNEPRMLVRVWVAKDSKMHTADSQLLNVNKENWTTNAIRYWSGDATPQPLLEVLVHGSIYLPDWESFQLNIPQ